MMRQLPILLLAGLAAACATTGAVPQPFPGGGTHTVPAPVSVPAGPEPGIGEPVEPASSTRSDGYEISGDALRLRGTPYRNGGSDPAGFDCSGFVFYVFGQHGVAVPRT